MQLQTVSIKSLKMIYSTLLIDSHESKYTPSDLSWPQLTSLQVTLSSGSQAPYLHCFCSGPDTMVSVSSQLKSRKEPSEKAESEYVSTAPVTLLWAQQPPRPEKYNLTDFHI